MKDQPSGIPQPNISDLRIGAMLRERRHVLKLTLTDVELATKIRGKFLVSLEACEYNALPNDIYTRGFVQSYADFLGLDGATVAMQYQNERGKPKRATPKGRRQQKARRFIVTPRLIIAATSAVVAISIVSYLAWEFQALAAAPRLTVTSPAGDEVIDGALTDVSGSVAGGADVFINDSPVLTDANGGFADKLALQEGVNVIRITAKNKLGKTTTVNRNVLARLPKPVVQPAPQPGAPATINGVTVVVSIKGGATALVVQSDGKEIFRGTMLDGTSQTFSGTKSVIITTNNAGTTNLSVTNSIAANKEINPVGRDGETKRNLEFDVDTVIQ